MITTRSARVIAVALAAAIGACGREPPAVWHQEASGVRWRELRVRGGSPGFTRMEGSRTGIRFENTVSDTVLLGNRMLGQGAGVALGDVDGDGRVDVFLARTQGPSALYKNLGGWKFKDITAASGIATGDRHASAAAFVDIDGDGDLDLVLLAATGPNAIFVNDGTGRFTEHRADLGIDTTGRGGATIAMADVDGDGDLDLFVANYKAYSPVDTIPPRDRVLSNLVRQVSPGRFEVKPEHQRDFKIVMRPDMGGLNLTMLGEPNDLYLNDNGRFSRVPLTAGRFRDAAGKPIAEEFHSFSLTTRFADLDGDGAPDLYVANDFEDRDQLWWDDGNGDFKLADWTAQRQLSHSSMGLDVGDVNGDGLPDLFVVDMLSNDTRRLRTQLPAHAPQMKHVGDLQTQLQQQRNTLFLNRGDRTFAELGLFAGVAATGWSWSTMFLDVDLDGRQDILVANGHLWDLMDGDIQERLQNELADREWRRQRWQFPRLALKNVAFRNRGDSTFEDVSQRWRFGTEDDISNAMAAADLDGDGDLDVVINRLRAPTLVLRNDADAPRVAVRLIGAKPNTHAVGAKIRLRGGAVPLQEREVTAGGLYMSHSDYLESFAMGNANAAELDIEWRDGRRSTLRDVRPNREYEITETSAAAEPPRAAVAPAVPTLFEDATPQLRGHVHVDSTYDDWQRQLLLTDALSQLGPGVAWFDYDRDGDEDLIIGAGRGGRLAVFRNDNGRLVPQGRDGPVAPADFTTPLGLSDSHGTRLLVGMSSWEGGGPTVPAVAGLTATSTVSSSLATVVPPGPFAVGPLALADYDGDGDLDLFVGGRAIPGAYPRAASSTLYRNDNGAFVVDTANSAVLKNVGLVTAALFADVDGDGDDDLVLARDWDSVLLLINDKGRFSPAPASWGLAKWTGRWNGIAAGDLNGDGRLDLIATSWGRNTMFPADTMTPLVMLHGPIGMRLEEEVFLARKDPRVGGLAPLNGYPRARVALPDLTWRLSSYSAYADAVMDSVFGALRFRVQAKDIVTLDHMAFINRGDHFEARPLPTEAQIAPAFYAGVADFDGDGREDVFLSQNFYPTAPGLPRYDEGRGLLMAGDGTGRLVGVPAARSGIVVYGDQRGAAYADYDHDGRLDLVVSQNGSTTRLLHNRGARPGLRVRLIGAPLNPDAVGAQVRLVFGDRMGPLREIEAGSGYWSENGATQVFGTPTPPSAVWVRWPGGRETRTTVPMNAREVVVRFEAR